MKKILSILLAAAIAISCVSIVSFAAETKGVEVTVTRKVAEDGTEADAGKEKVTASYYLTSLGETTDFSFLKSQQDENGVSVVKFNVWNTSGKDIRVRVVLQAAWNNVASSKIDENGKGEYNREKVLIPANGCAELSYKVQLDANGNISTVNDVGKKTATDVSLSKVNLRFDFHNATDASGVDANTKVVIAPVDNDNLIDALTKIKARGTAKSTGLFVIESTSSLPATPTPVTPAPETPTPAGEENTPAPTATPVPKVVNGVKYSVKQDIESDQYICSATGVIGASDVKDGTLTKTLSIKNTGKTEITVLFMLQATVIGTNGQNTWAAPDKGNGKVTVEPGKTEKLTFSCDSDGKTVTILDQEVALDKLFFRFDISGEAGDKYLPEGTSFTVFCDTDEANLLFEGKSYANKESIVKELSYGTNGNAQHDGDILPVAFACVAIAAATALVVVTKKKKEIL